MRGFSNASRAASEPRKWATIGPGAVSYPRSTASSKAWSSDAARVGTADRDVLLAGTHMECRRCRC